MELLFQCAQCAAHLRATEEEAGLETQCPTCFASMRIPIGTGETVCQGCGIPLKFAAEVAGLTFHCPGCGGPLILPQQETGRVKIRLKRSASKQATDLPAIQEPVRAVRPVEPVKAANSKRGLFEFGRRSWCLVNCLTGERHTIEQFPWEVGSGNAVDLRLEGIAPQQLGLAETRGGEVCLTPRDDVVPVIVNGQAVSQPTALLFETDYSIKIGQHFFTLRGGKKLAAWAEGINIQEWMLFSTSTRALSGPFSRDALAEFLAHQDLDPRATVVFLKGVQTGFYLHEFTEALGGTARREGSGGGASETPSNTVAPAEDGDLLCPVCWLRFDKGDVMHIAAHESLRGDPVLGEDAMLRFQATRFNNHGHAVDAMGLPCPDVACPHCRRKLPAGFLDIPHKIISLVGETTAGKSYYLSVVAKVLPEVLYREFGVVFKDLDPTGNMKINAMKNRLFSGASPEQVRLEKTQREGDLYERVVVRGQELRLPTPFMFQISPRHHDHARHGLVFYDLAGELFQPGVTEHDAPKTQHVAVASAVLFLFDPTLNREFRRRLVSHPDPQLQSRQNDQQDTLLAEMEARIKRLLHLDARDRFRTPVAILVGKCDIWLPLLGDEPLQPVIRDKHLDLAAIAANSRRVRGLLEELSPSIVANAESLAHEVMFFPVSSFGHSPVKLPGGDLAPDPQRLRPLHVEQPFLWALAKQVPGLIPIHNDTGA